MKNNTFVYHLVFIFLWHHIAPKMYWTNNPLLKFIEHFKVPMKFFFFIIVFLSFLEHTVCIQICVPAKKKKSGLEQLFLQSAKFVHIAVYKTSPV